jgi:peroxiredoxin
VPDYLAHQDALRELGIKDVVVYSVNDSAVMTAWSKDQKAGLSMLHFMGDPAGELTRALDMELTHPGPRSKGLLGRCKRHAIYADDGVIKVVRVSESEDDPAGDKNPSMTLSEAMIAAVKELS